MQDKPACISHHMSLLMSNVVSRDNHSSKMQPFRVRRRASRLSYPAWRVIAYRGVADHSALRQLSTQFQSFYVVNKLSRGGQSGFLSS